MTSLALAVMVGAVAGSFGILPYMAKNGTLNEKDLITLITVGYAGTDFIEGFISSQKLPK